MRFGNNIFKQYYYAAAKNSIFFNWSMTTRQPDKYFTRKYLTNRLENRNRKEAQPDSILQANTPAQPAKINLLQIYSSLGKNLNNLNVL